MTESERGRIRRDRHQTVTEYGDLFRQVAEILLRHDPIGLHALGLPADEYEPEARTILPRLGECSSVLDTRRVIHEEFTRWFDGPRSNIAGDESRYEEPARDIWDLWTRSTLA